MWSAYIKLIGCVPEETSLFRWTGDCFCPPCSEQGVRFSVSLSSTGSIFCKETTKSVCVCVFFFFIVHCSKQGEEFKLSVATLRLNLSQEIPGEGGVIPKRKTLELTKKKARFGFNYTLTSANLTGIQFNSCREFRPVSRKSSRGLQQPIPESGQSDE